MTRSEPREFFVFFFLAVLVAGRAGAETYYVRNGGNDDLDGLSHGTAWATLAKVDAAVDGTGDDVYLHEGSTWNETLTIDWTGTAGDPAVVGAYTMDGDIERVGYRTEKPVITGGYVEGMGWLDKEEHALPDRDWGAMIRIRADHVVLQDLRITRSGEHGVVIAASQYVTVQRVDTDVTYRSGINAREGGHHTVKHCTVRECGRSYPDWDEDAGAAGFSQNWPACIVAELSAHNVFEGNHVYESYGEGIGMYFDGADNNTVQDNLISARAVGVYIDHGRYNTVQRNLIYGTTDSTYHRNEGYVGSGLGLNTESGTGSNNAEANRFLNNLVAFTRVGIWFGAQGGGAGAAVDNIASGNTLVATRYGLNLEAQGDRARGNVVKNNLVFDVESALCSAPDSAGDDYEINNNLWPAEPSSGACIGSNDVIAPDPALVRMEGWRTISTSNMPAAVDFAPLDASPAIGAGAAMADLAEDYFRQVRNDPPAIGAIEAVPPVEDHGPEAADIIVEESMEPDRVESAADTAVTDSVSDPAAADAETEAGADSGPGGCGCRIVGA